MGVWVANAVAGLCVCYVVVLSVGLNRLRSPAEQIADPWFTAMELLILLIAPLLICLALAIYNWVPEQQRTSALGGVVFMGICSAMTSCVHFSVLVFRHQPQIAGQSWAPSVFAFQWPSVAYVLDVLAWDVFFPVAALFAAVSLRGIATVRAARRLLYLSAALAAFGLAGIPLANMQVRNVGIVGYAVVFPIASALLARAFRR